MVGYLQSRGRARHKTSTFIIMVQEGAQAQAERYLQFLNSEPHLKKVYQDRDIGAENHQEDELEDELPDPDDLAERERYVVSSTGAILTYNSAIGLLNHLCSLIPRDRQSKTSALAGGTSAPTSGAREGLSGYIP